MIRTEELTRTFRGADGEDVHAVRGIDLTVLAGETVAVLGPNGAGKSTLMRMLSTLLPPSGGRAEVAGHDTRTAPALVRQSIGYVGQGNGAGHTQRVIDEVITQGRIYGLDRAASRARAAELLDTLGLGQLTRRKTQAMSGGQRRRLDLAMGLVHSPPLLFLDEPTTGLDPQNRANLWEHLARMRHRTGMTVVFTTHYLDEADLMAERVVVIDHGRIIADDTPRNLKRHHAGDRVTFEVDQPSAADQLSVLLTGVEGARDIAVRGSKVSARVSDGPAALPAVIGAARDRRLSLVAADAQLPTLDDVFLELTGRSLRDAGEPAPTDTALSPSLLETGR